MKSIDEDIKVDVVAKVVLATSIVYLVKKKVEEVTDQGSASIELILKEMKCKDKILEAQRVEARKKTMRLYF